MANPHSDLTCPNPKYPISDAGQDGVPRRKAILHIGTMKTGTSSIQAMLAQNRPWLAKRGYAFVPGLQRTSEQIASRIAALKPGQNLILSDEGLWHFARSPRSDTARIAEALKDFDVTILTYLRRPDGFWESWFVQGLKHGTGTPSISAFRKSPFVRSGSNILERLKIFSDLFGKNTIRLAPYERAQMAHGDAMIDFLVRIGLVEAEADHESLTATGLVWPTEKNVTPDSDTMLLVSLLRQLGQVPEPELKQLMETAATRKGQKTQILQAQECENINATYRPMFAKVQKRYGGGADPEFFLDWSVGDAKPLCALRPIYDRMIDKIQRPSAPLPSVQTPRAPLHVAFVIQKLAGQSGGAERVFIETAEAMAARGISTRLICFDAHLSGPLAFGTERLLVTSVLPAWLQRRNPALHNSPTSPATARISRAEALLKSLPNIFPLTHVKWMLSHGLFQRALKRELQRTPVDVIVAFLPPAITAAARAGKELGIPVIASTHNLPQQDFGTSSDRWDQNPVYRARTLEALGQATCVTVLQPEFQTWISTVTRAPVRVIPNPVSRLCPLLAPLPTRDKIILGVGRLTRIKRWDLLIEAFALVATDLPGWSLRLFGSGAEQGALQARITTLKLESRIAILPSTPDLGSEYDRASILVHPSEFEGFGLSVAEAMAHGVPVLAFADCQGVNRLIDSNENGILLQRGSNDEAVGHLAAGLTHLAKDALLRQSLGQSAAKIAQRFDAKTIYDDWAEMLHKVAGK